MELINQIPGSGSVPRYFDHLDIAKRGYSRFLRIIHFTGDLIWVNIAFLIAYILKFDHNPVNGLINDHYVFLHIVFNLAWMIVVSVLNIYNIKRISSAEEVLWNILKAVFLHALCVIGFLFAIKTYSYSRSHLLVSYVLVVVLVAGWRLLFIQALKRYRSRGRNYRNVVIIGADTLGVQLQNFLQYNPHLGYRLLGFFDNHAQPGSVLGTLDDIGSYVSTNHVDELYCTIPLTEREKITELIALADNNMVRFKMIPDLSGLLNKKVTLDFYDDVPVMMLRPEPLELMTNRYIKRGFDILFSSAVIVCVFPWLYPVVALFVRISSPGPVIFSQKRSGLNNREFNCYKFRTMKVNAESDLMQATHDDVRITATGRFLRKTSLDELPQFWNVLVGDMSVVGPRPHMVKHTTEYSRIISQFMVRHFARPGITGWAQVNGFRGNTSNPEFMVQRVKHDVWYIENYTFLKDIKIILLTILSIVKGDKNAG